MADEVDPVDGLAPVVGDEPGPREDFVDEVAQLVGRAPAVLAPVVREAEHRGGAVGLLRQVMAQREDQVLVDQPEERPRLDPRGLDRLVADVVRMERDPLVLLVDDGGPDLLRDDGIGVLEAGGGDSRNDDDGRLRGHGSLPPRSCPASYRKRAWSGSDCRYGRIRRNPPEFLSW